MMFREVLRFELGFQFRRPLLYVFSAVFFFMTFGAISTDSVMIGGSIGNVARNAPYVIINMLCLMSIMGLFFITIFIAPSVNRDRDRGIQELFFSTPMRKSAYLLGRFFGSVLPVAAAMIMSCLGIIVASAMPWQDPAYIAKFNLWPYLYSMAIFVLPNLFLAGAIYFSISTLTKKIFSAYVAAVVFLSLWGISQAVMGNLENQAVVSLIDPFGWSPFRIMTRYWTIVERNTKMLSPGGPMLLNRLIWIAIGTCVLAFTVRRYRMVTGEGGASRKRLKEPGSGAVAVDGPIPRPADTAAVTDAARDYTLRARLSQYIYYARIETRNILRSIPFLVITMIGAANLIAGMLFMRSGTTAFPLTQEMIRSVEGTFELLPLIVIIIYGAELVWRDRRIRIHEIIDAMPVPNWVPLMSRLTALIAVSFIMTIVALICTVAFQAANGYFNFEPFLYLKGLFLILFGEWLLLCVLAVFFQVVTGNRYLGTLLMVLYFIIMEVLPSTGYNHRLYMFARAPSAPYSDMNGYGHFAAPVFWFRLYWSFLAAVMIIIANWLWVRGYDTRFGLRLRQLGKRITRRSALALAASALGFVMIGGWIFYNTNILNEYRTQDDITRIRALYEKRYKQYENVPQPKVAAARLNVDVYPERRDIDIRGTLTLVNRTGDAIERLHLSLDRTAEINSLILSGGNTEIDDGEVGYRVYNLGAPLAPGDTLDLGFDISVITRGFMNNGSDVRILGNGSFFDNTHYIPRIGYFGEYEIYEPAERKKHDLPGRPRMAAADDTAALQKTFIRDADRIRFEAVVSTSPDQIAIAPGYLQREWMENGRRYFHYKMDAPIHNLYAFISGRYEVARSDWNGLPVEIYYHKPHDINVGRMIESVKKSLDYYTANFSPFQYRHVRIVEFPRYRSFAMSLPNTIPHSESASFVDDLRDEDNLDMLFYITAHEMGHQWWAHQVTSADVQGGTMVMESMAQYSALMVMEKDYGRDRMKKFLRYELDRYLRGRGGEMKEEMPLMLVENQPYIYYNKGSLVMYALRDYIGEEAFNGAIRKYIRATAYKGPPYTNSIEFVSYVREAVPEKYKYLIEDMFETITLYDNRTDKVTVTGTDDGRYRVTLAYRSHKMRADGKGKETEIGHNDWIEVGVYGEKAAGGKTVETTLYQKKHRLESGSSEIEIIVDERPVRAGIDPRNLLIDRVPDDNVRKVAG